MARYSVIGTKGMLSADPGYEYSSDIRLTITRDGKDEEKVYPKHDQFVPELIYFFQCILEDREPEPDGEEGLIDVQIVRAAYRACTSGKVTESAHRERRPEPPQGIQRPPVEEPELMHAEMPSCAKKN